MTCKIRETSGDEEGKQNRDVEYDTNRCIYIYIYTHTALNILFDGEGKNNGGRYRQSWREISGVGVEKKMMKEEGLV